MACKDADSNVVNLSLVGAGFSVAEDRTIHHLMQNGILVVASAGNGGLKRNLRQYPASYRQVMAVAAVDVHRSIGNFSTHNEYVNLAAPGVSVLSLSNSKDTYMEGSGQWKD